MNNTYASGADIENALQAWHRYVNRKIEANPGILDIYARDFLQPKDKRTLWLSLVEGVGQELSGLGALVSAEKPHAYVEGIIGLDKFVGFMEGYFERFLPNGSTSSPFITDRDNTFLRYLKERGVQPEKFLLMIRSTNDGFLLGLDDLTKELVILEDAQLKSAYALYSNNGNLNIDQATVDEINTVIKSFTEAASQLTIK